ncbi:hypothetical protein niasHS_007034 [Heterodera schachtii]|uniref:Uncharacterized protein n=1 Tax=Heterodera schachtii TaxID=97005 RepID=A0ABD2JFG9_HETSC
MINFLRQISESFGCSSESLMTNWPVTNWTMCWRSLSKQSHCTRRLENCWINSRTKTVEMTTTTTEITAMEEPRAERVEAGRAVRRRGGRSKNMMAGFPGRNETEEEAILRCAVKEQPHGQSDDQQQLDEQHLSPNLRLQLAGTKKIQQILSKPDTLEHFFPNDTQQVAKIRNTFTELWGLEDNSTVKLPALHIAAKKEDVRSATLLLESEQNLNVTSKSGFNPLHFSAFFPGGSLTKTIKVSLRAQPVPHELVNKLHGNRVAVSPVTVEPRRRKFHKDCFTPVAVALQQGHDRIVALLLENDNTSTVKLPALHIAAKKEDVRSATLLLESEQNPNVTSKSGFNPLRFSLDKPDTLEHFFPNDPQQVAKIRNTFTELWGLEENDDITKAVIVDAMKNCHDYVMKSQMDG